MAKSEKGLSARLDEFETAVDEWLHDHQDVILEEDAIGGIIADTNALGWHVYQFDLERMVWERGRDIAQWRVRVYFQYGAEGDQDEDHMYCGDHVWGSAELVIPMEGEPYLENIKGELDESYVGQDADEGEDY